jgi:hypothetical protein
MSAEGFVLPLFRWLRHSIPPSWPPLSLHAGVIESAAAGSSVERMHTTGSSR